MVGDVRKVQRVGPPGIGSPLRLHLCPGRDAPQYHRCDHQNGQENQPTPDHAPSPSFLVFVGLGSLSTDVGTLSPFAPFGGILDSAAAPLIYFAYVAQWPAK